MCTMDYPKFIVSNQKEESISIQMVKKKFDTVLLSYMSVYFLWIADMAVIDVRRIMIKGFDYSIMI